MPKFALPRTVFLIVFTAAAGLLACQQIELRDPKYLICPDYHPLVEEVPECYWPDELP